MKKVLITFLIVATTILHFGCETENNPVTPSGFKGYIYYSNGGEIARIKLSDQTVEKLMSNATQADITSNSDIIAVESYPTERIIITDLYGANRQSIIESESYTGPKHKYYFDRPRISFNQQYIAYEGDDVYNPITYVINSTDGSLVATIGDYDERLPFISPSWAPDGSLFVQGWTSMNNGIYKITPDFSSIARIDPNLTNVSHPNVSPDGSKIAFIRDGKLWTMGLDGSNATLIQTNVDDITMPTWSPDSKFIAASGDGKLYIIDIGNKVVTQLEHAYASEGSQLTWRY